MGSPRMRWKEIKTLFTNTNTFKFNVLNKITIYLCHFNLHSANICDPIRFHNLCISQSLSISVIQARETVNTYGHNIE